MGMRSALLFVIALLFAAPAMAADLTVTIRSTSGQSVRDAVVTLQPTAAQAPAPIRFSWPYKVTQQNLQFDPFVLIVPQGSEVSFPNKDGVRHHVYSFSSAKPFELKLYGKDESRSVKFDKTGIVALGCNIHDGMVGFVIVVDTPYAMKSDASGSVTLRGAPAGPATLRIWHPYMKAGNNQIERRIVVPAGGMTEAVVVQLRPAPDHSRSY